MKNLSLNFVGSNKVEYEVKPEACCFLDDTLYFIAKHQLLAVQPGEVRHVCNLLEIPEIEDNPTSTPVSMTVCNETGHIVVCLASGDLLEVEVDNASAEYVGGVDAGIAAAAWSPAGDVLAIVTLSFNLVLLSQELYHLAETELRGAGEEQPVSVGWGKKETQFRGSEGKLKSEYVTPTAVAGYDDGKVRMSWREDGECLVVSFKDETQRYLKVFRNDGTLLHNSEFTPGLESALCWRPNGAIIASTQRLPNKHMVCFFEKNLLPHGGFQLDEDSTVQELTWNSDSSILAVVVTLGPPSAPTETVIKLFTVGNYHWYHKFTVAVPEGEHVVAVCWDEKDAFTLHLVTSTNKNIKHSRWSFRWTVDSSSGASPDDASWVAVVDGQSLLLTAFRNAVIPPPMSSTKLELNQRINSVGFLQFGAEGESTSSNDFFVNCGNGSVHVYKYNSSEKKHELFASGIAPDCVLFQVSWVAPNCLFACALTPDGDYDLVQMDIVCSEEVKTMQTQRKRVQKPLVAMRRVPGKKTVFLWTSPQNWLEFDPDSQEFSGQPEPVQAAGRLLAVEVRGQEIVLDSAHRLYAGKEIIARNATSFRISNEHLLVTTLQHKLLCWRMTDLTATASERPLERGARIVTVVPSSSSVVLQLPRGNLEVVQPRALTITSLKALLDSLRFAAGLKVMRRERVNMNLLHDHNPRNFESNIKLFIQDVADPSLLCTFIAELSNENVTHTLYSSFYPLGEKDYPGKVDLVCALLLSEFERREDKASYLLPILSCLVKKGDTEGALGLVQSTLAAEKRGSPGPVTSSQGLGHVLYLVDLEQLFKIALGTYDLSLVMFIASKSQKDPKEYLPFLSGLQQMEENYQKFTIDNFLKRYKKALGHLALCQDRVTECLDFVVKHNLYRPALRMFALDTDSWKAVCVLYGAELTRQTRHEEAGLLLQRAEELLLAQHAFNRAGAWRHELACAHALSTSEDELSDLYRSMVDSLLTSRRYNEAARLLLDHVGDVEGGVSALCTAQQHDEAVRVAALRGRRDLIASHIRPSALSALANHKQTLNDCAATFEQHLKRLQDAQALRELSGPLDWDDTASESSRGSSRGSSRASSTRSAKNSRKLERNLMKKGGPFEEVALVAALHDVATHTAALKSQVRALNLALVSLDEQVAAAGLQSLLHRVLERIKANLTVIWPGPNAAPDESTSNSIAAAFTATKRLLPAPVQALQPKILFPPDLLNRVEWQLDILLDY